MKILKTRQFRFRYTLLLLLVLALAIWLNLELLKMEHIVCLSASGGICDEILLFTLFEIAAYGTILLFALLLIYRYLFHKKLVEEVQEETTEEVQEETIEEVQEETIEEVQEYTTEEVEVTEPKVVTTIKIPRRKVIVKYKKDIINYVDINTDLTKNKSFKVVNIIFDEITTELIKGNDVNIEDFGKFKKYSVKEHAGVNPGTGESIIIEAHNRVSFSPSRTLRNIFREQKPDFSEKEYVTTETVLKESELVPVEAIVQDVTEPKVEEAIIENKDSVKEEMQIVQSVKAPKRKVVVKHKKDIIQYVLTNTELSKNMCSNVVNIIFDEITDELVKGNFINIEEFGKFNKYKVNEHAGVNPGTGEKIVIEAHNRVKFAASPQLKQLFISQEPDFLEKEYIASNKVSQVEETARFDTLVKDKVTNLSHVEEIIPVVESLKQPKTKVVSKHKKDIINYVSRNTKLSKNMCSNVVNIIFDEITEELVKGNVINIEDFGKFNKYQVNEHAGVNPGTGEKIVIKAHNRVKFAASLQLKQLFATQDPDSTDKN